MGKQKLTSKQVELIKHLRVHLLMTQKNVSDYFDGMVTRECISKIDNEMRWSEVKIPSFARGQELLNRYNETKNLETD